MANASCPSSEGLGAIFHGELGGASLKAKFQKQTRPKFYVH